MANDIDIEGCCIRNGQVDDRIFHDDQMSLSASEEWLRDFFLEHELGFIEEQARNFYRADPGAAQKIIQTLISKYPDNPKLKLWEKIEAELARLLKNIQE
ncbi:MAG: hypothetical protein V1821_04265 [bacterium]